jgi:hypothetical protein
VRVIGVGATGMAVAVLAGCGSQAVGGKRPVTHAELIARANSVCRQARVDSDPVTYRALGLRRLRSPLADKDLYGHLVGAAQEALAAERAVADARKDGVGGSVPIELVAPVAVAEGKIAGYARRLGADECARPLGTLPP